MMQNNTQMNLTREVKIHRIIYKIGLTVLVLFSTFFSLYGQLACPDNISEVTELGSCDLDLEIDNPMPDGGDYLVEQIRFSAGNLPPANLPDQQNYFIDFPSTISANFERGETIVTITYFQNATFETCSFTVTIEDEEKPVLSNCPPNTTLVEQGLCGRIVNFNSPNASDNCEISGAVTNDAPPDNFYFVGTTTVTYRVEDVSGNAAECSFNVTIVDLQPPTLVCPENITVNNDINQCGAVVEFSAITSDNCSLPEPATSIPASGSFFEVGTTAVTYSVRDFSNNEVSCSFDITIVDNQDLVLNCPENITVNNDLNQCGAIVDFSAMVSDNCSLLEPLTSTPASGSFFEVGMTAVTYSVRDFSNNEVTCNFDVTVLDNQTPILTCPENVTVNNDLNQCGAVVHFSATASDNCSLLEPPTSTPASGSFFEVGTTAVTYSVRDFSNNEVSCSFEIIVVDNQAPILTCPENITVNNDINQCGAIVDFSATASDNCSLLELPTSTPASGSFFEIGTTLVTFFASDFNGHTDLCNFTITIQDVEAPRFIQCAPTITSLPTPPFECSAFISLDNMPILVSDNCNYQISHNSNEVFPVGITEVEWEVIDDVGQADYCTQTIRVLDIIPPTIDCLSEITVNADDVCSISIEELIPTATDDCGLVNMNSDAPQEILIGTTQVIWTATDEYNNVSTCVQNITVEINEPDLVCPSNQSVAIENTVGAAAFWSVPEIDETCGFYLSSTFQSGDFFEYGTTEVHYMLNRPSGEIVNTCQFNIRVYDPLIIACPDEIGAVLSSDNSSEFLSWNIPAALSECAECKEIEIENFIYLGTFEGHRYYFSKNQKNWYEAQQVSLDNHAYLATINNVKENNFLANLLPEPAAFIGLNDDNLEGTLSWENTEEVSFISMETNIENDMFNDFGILQTSGAWLLIPNSPQFFIMEKPCVDIELLTTTLPNNLTAGNYLVEYRYSSICGTSEDCYFEINLENQASVAYCETGVLKNSNYWEDTYFWIEELHFGDESYYSGNDLGYGDYSEHLFTVSPDQLVPLEIRPNQWNVDLPYYVKVWVDWNRDGDFFDDNEVLLQEKLSINQYTDMQIPNSLSNGLYRMRVVLSNRDNVEACFAFEQGEAEDYTLQIINFSNRSYTQNKDISLSPNPAQTSTTLRLPFYSPHDSYYEIYNLFGQKLSRQAIPEGVNHLKIDFKDLDMSNRYYQIRIIVPERQVITLPLIIHK